MATACSQHTDTVAGSQPNSETVRPQSSSAAAQSPPAPPVTAPPSTVPSQAPATTAASSAPTASPAAPLAQTPSSSPAPSNDEQVPMLAPDAPPQIVAVHVNSTNVRPGDQMSGDVVTSSNVASVEVRVGPYGMGMNKVGVGHFAMSYQLGPIPPAFRGDYTMTIIARNTRGDTATRTIALTVR